jgi:flagellar biosynthesis anti-sigma factor FlgM
MTALISSSLPLAQPVSDAKTSQPSASAKPIAADEATPLTEAVTLSDAAQTSTQLLTSARQADGVDHAMVARVRNALAGGNYNVAPEDLARAMVTVLKASAK